MTFIKEEINDGQLLLKHPVYALFVAVLDQISSNCAQTLLSGTAQTSSWSKIIHYHFPLFGKENLTVISWFFGSQGALLQKSLPSLLGTVWKIRSLRKRYALLRFSSSFNSILCIDKETSFSADYSMLIQICSNSCSNQRMKIRFTHVKVLRAIQFPNGNTIFTSFQVVTIQKGRYISYYYKLIQ